MEGAWDLSLPTDLELESQEWTLADADAEGRIPLWRSLAGPLRQRLQQLPVPLERGLGDQRHLLDRQGSHRARGLPQAIGELCQGVEVSEGGLELGAVQPVALPHAPVNSTVDLRAAPAQRCPVKFRVEASRRRARCKHKA